MLVLIDRFVSKFALLLIGALFVAPCGLSIARQLDRSDWELMSDYGAQLRLAYRTDNPSITNSENFRAIEVELERRKLVDRDKYFQIQRGIIYLGMPASQVAAAVDAFRQVDYLSLPDAEIYTFVGSPPPGGYERMTPQRKGGGRLLRMVPQRDKTSKTTIVVCNDRVVKVNLPNGLITAETYNRGFGGGGIQFQTNFPPGFWDDANKKARVRGRRVYEDPDTYGDSFDHFLWSQMGTGQNEMLPSKYWESNQFNPGSQFQQRLNSRRPIC